MNIERSYRINAQIEYPIKNGGYSDKVNSYKNIIKENIIKLKEYLQKKK